MFMARLALAPVQLGRQQAKTGLPGKGRPASASGNRRSHAVVTGAGLRQHAAASEPGANPICVLAALRATAARRFFRGTGILHARHGSSRAKSRHGRATAARIGPQTRAALQRIERLAYRLDERYRLPGTRFGFGPDGIIGLVPGIGDAATSAPSG
jgi:hypothetical protein